MSGPPINVIIPLGGLGSRFQKEGYLTRPKPFVRVLGKEMILWVVDNLSIRSDDGLVLVYNPSWMSMDVFMREILAAKYPQATLVELPGPTRGAAETVLLGLRGLDKGVRGRATLLADGDTFYTADIVNRFREASARLSAPPHDVRSDAAAALAGRAQEQCRVLLSRHAAQAHLLVLSAEG